MSWGSGSLVVATFIVHIHYILAQQKCGLVPSKVYLAKGEKRQLVFWTDQDYSQAITVTAQPTTTTGSTSTSTEAEVDSFLQAVNGQLPGFGSNKGEEGPFQFGNKTDANDATVVNAESVFFDASNEAIENTNNSSISSELIAPLNITFENENEVEGGDSGISFPNDISNMINTEDNDIDDTNNGSTDEPITAANVIEVEADAWEDIPNNEIPIQVDNWPSVQAVIVEEEQSTSNNSDVTTEPPESDVTVTDESQSTGNTEEPESDHPVTAANVIEIEENAWKEPFEDNKATLGDDWPSPPVDAIVAEEELIDDLNKSVEATTNIPYTSNDAQNDDYKVPDEPVLSVDIENVQNILKEGSQHEEMATTSSELSIKKVEQETTTQSEDVNQRDGADTTIVAVDINQETKQETTPEMSDEITTINTIVVKETTTLYEEINQETTSLFDEVGEETTTESRKINTIDGQETTIQLEDARVRQATTTESEILDSSVGQKKTTESDKFSIRVEQETTTDSETFYIRDGPETTTKSEQFNPRDGQETTREPEIFNPRDGTETTTEQEQFNPRDGQETTTEPEIFNPRDGTETTTEQEQFNQRNGQESTTDQETFNPRDSPETTTEQEQFNSRDRQETTESAVSGSKGVKFKIVENIDKILVAYQNITDYEADSLEEIVTEEPATIPILEIGVIEQTMPEQASISFEDETVQPVNLTTQTASDNSSSNKKIIVINDESIDTTTDYSISNEINDDDPGNDDYQAYNFETSTFTIKTNEDSESKFNESNDIVTGTPIEVTENEISDTEFWQSSESNNDESEVKIQVVTSMTLKESEQILQDINSNNDKISVVTSIPVEELVKSWDELELFEEVDQADNNNKPIKVAQKLFDETKHNPTEEESTTIADASTSSEKNMEELLVESTTVINRSADQSFPKVFEETTRITDYIDTENENFKSVETTDEPTSDTINISTQDDNKSQDSLNEDASILFGLAIPNDVKSTEATTYFPISDNEIQDDDDNDDDEYSYYDDNFDISPFEKDDSLKIFAFTTTGSPGTSKDTSNNEDLSLPVIAAVVAELEDSEEIFDETTTGSSISQTNNGLVDSMVNVDETDKFEIEAVESETESDEIQIEFDETTTGSSVFLPQVEAVIVEEEEEDILEDGSDKQKEFDETTIGDFEIEAIFADTTTGSPLENNELFKKETANVYIHDENNDQDNIHTTTVNDDTKDTTDISTVDLITSTPSFLAGETPAFTTASSRINTTASSVDLEQSDSSRIIFPSEDEDTIAIFNFKENIEDEKHNEVAEKTTTIPQVKDDVVKLIEDVLTQKISEEEVASEATTVRVVIDDAEVTRRNIITILSENQTSSSTESGVISKQPGHTESEIVQVEAGNVNGPLSLDEVIYYDDADGNEDDSEIDTANSNTFVDLNAEDKPFVEKVEDSENRDELTTEINGFVVNKKQIVKTINNNDIETVRTSGDKESVNINISKDNNTVENKSDTTIKPTDSNEDVKNLETTTTTGDNVDNFKQATVETTVAPALNDKELVTDQTEKLSTKNPHVVIDVVDNVLKLEKEDVIIEANASTESNILNTTLVAQNDTTTEKDKKPATFPVTELLNGIYKLIQGYIPTRAEIDPSIETLQTDSKVDNTKYPNNIEYFDSPNAEPLYNVHNAPRDTTPFTTRKTINNIEDSVDFANSNTDPFQQLSAPDLTGLIPETEREDNVQYIFASQVKKSPAITLSPFNSDALKVQEPPKVLFDKTQENIDTEDEEEESGFSSLTKVIQQPFKVFLPSFLTSPKIKTKSDKVQVAGSLPVTVRDPSNSQRMQVVRRPIQKPVQRGQQDATKSRFPILGSLFSSLSTNSPKKQAHKPRRPLRPDVPAQQPIQTGFVPIPTRQRSSPVSIPLPGTVDTDQQSSESQFSPKIGRLAREEPVFEAADSIDKQILSFIQSRPIPMRDALLKPRSLDQEFERSRREAEEPVNCTWTIQTEKNLYLLVTFHNLSAPFTVDCEGAYIEVERENNGFEARWCGNRVTQGGSRPHVIFARNEVRITVFDDGLEGKNLPTGFNADVEVIDLFDAGEFSSLRKTKGYSSVREVAGRSIL